MTKVSEAQILAAIQSQGSLAKAAALLGIAKSSIHERLAKIKRREQPTGVPTQDVPAHHSIKGVSTLYDEQGAKILQWVKTNVALEANLVALKDAIKAEFADVPRFDTQTFPKRPNYSLLTENDHVFTVYPIGDAHFGMYAWGDETGNSFDLDIARQDLGDAMSRLVCSTPMSKSCLIANVGDFFHADNSANATPRSNNILDVDTRFTKVLRVGIAAMRYLIELALGQHDTVYVVNAPGNHDPHASIILNLALEAYYEKVPRVVVNTSPSPFYYHEFGENLIGVYHGDTIKPELLIQLMASDQAEAWGRTTFRHFITGHVHHKRVFELPGGIVESFRTLAAKDAWHNLYGYRSGRNMQAIVYHSKNGEIERHTVDISQLRTDGRQHERSLEPTKS
jgi:hypothetical protein